MEFDTKPELAQKMLVRAWNAGLKPPAGVKPGRVGLVTPKTKE